MIEDPTLEEENSKDTIRKELGKNPEFQVIFITLKILSLKGWVKISKGYHRLYFKCFVGPENPCGAPYHKYKWASPNRDTNQDQAADIEWSDVANPYDCTWEAKLEKGEVARIQLWGCDFFGMNETYLGEICNNTNRLKPQLLNYQFFTDNTIFTRFHEACHLGGSNENDNNYPFKIKDGITCYCMKTSSSQTERNKIPITALGKKNIKKKQKLKETVLNMLLFSHKPRRESLYSVIRFHSLICMKKKW
jgi:hypothetical protein